MTDFSVFLKKTQTFLALFITTLKIKIKRI